MGDYVIINCVGLGATIGGDWPVGAYLASYAPEANDGWGDATWTPDPSRAMVFDDAVSALELYKAIPANRPTRPDGKPNRPLTMFGIELVAAEQVDRPTVAATMRKLDQR